MTRTASTGPAARPAAPAPAARAARWPRCTSHSTTPRCSPASATRGKNIYLIGHTDTSGTEEYNIALSERRAQAVADYMARLGTDPARMQIVPKGETEPTGLGDDKDRRVEFQWH
jgi:hypothetical protein